MRAAYLADLTSSPIPAEYAVDPDPTMRSDLAMASLSTVASRGVMSPPYTSAPAWSSSELGDPAVGAEQYDRAPAGRSLRMPLVVAGVVAAALGVGAVLGIAITDLAGSPRSKTAVVIPANAVPAPAVPSVVPAPAANPAGASEPADVAPPAAAPVTPRGSTLPRPASIAGPATITGGDSPVPAQAPGNADNPPPEMPAAPPAPPAPSVIINVPPVPIPTFAPPPVPPIPPVPSIPPVPPVPPLPPVKVTLPEPPAPPSLPALPTPLPVKIPMPPLLPCQGQPLCIQP